LVVVQFEFLSDLCGISSRTLRGRILLIFQPEQEPLTAKFAKERPQSTQRNS